MAKVPGRQSFLLFLVFSLSVLSVSGFDVPVGLAASFGGSGPSGLSGAVDVGFGTKCGAAVDGAECDNMLAGRGGKEGLGVAAA